MEAIRRAGRNALLTLVAATGALSAAPAFAALGDHIWTRGYEAAGAVALDGSDNIVTYGAFFGTIDLGGGPLTAVNFLGGDLYLARFDAAGNHIWSQQFTPNASFGVFNQVVAADGAGNIYFGGALAGGDIDFGGGTIAGNQCFLAKFDSAGNHVWSAGYGNGRILAIDTDGTHLAVVGYTSSGVDFGGGTIGTAGGNDAYVAKLTTAGAHVWSASFGDATDQGAFDVSIDNAGNLAVVGSMFGTVDFGGGPLVANLLDLFLVSFTPAGAHGWSQVFDGTFSSGGGILVNIALDTGASNQIVLAGQMDGSVDFGGGTLTSAGFGDVFVAQFAANGAHSWSNVYGATTGTDYAGSVAVDGSGNLIVCGAYAGDASFGGAVFPVTGFISPFYAVYDGSGAHLYSNGLAASVSTCFGRFTSSADLLVNTGGAVDFGGGTVTPSALVLAKLEGLGGGSTGVEVTSASRVDLAAYPNPFRPSTRIQYTLEAPTNAAVAVYDVRGRRIETLVPSRRHEAGDHSAVFSAAGAAGVYFVRLETEAGARTVRVVALR